MMKYLAMMMIVSSALLVKSGSPDNLNKRDELWHYLKVKNKTVYRIITHRKLGLPLQSKNRAGRKIIVWGYYFFNRIYGFNQILKSKALNIIVLNITGSLKYEGPCDIIQYSILVFYFM